MINLYSYSDYRAFIRDFVKDMQEADKKVSFSSLADKINIQRSYFSRALHGECHLSSDQLFLLGKAFGLGPEEMDYFLLILEIEKCQILARRDFLVAKLNRIRAKQLRSEVALETQAIVPDDIVFSEYFGNVYCPLVHVFLTIPKFHGNLESIRQYLNLTRQTFDGIVNILNKCKIIEIKKEGVLVKVERLHLSAGSVLSKLYATQFRLKAIEYQQQRNDQENYFFTFSFSVSPEDRLEIRAKFMEFLKWLSKRIEHTVPREVLHLNFDLFKI